MSKLPSPTKLRLVIVAIALVTVAAGALAFHARPHHATTPAPVEKAETPAVAPAPPQEPAPVPPPVVATTPPQESTPPAPAPPPVVAAPKDTAGSDSVGQDALMAALHFGSGSAAATCGPTDGSTQPNATPVLDELTASLPKATAPAVTPPPHATPETDTAEQVFDVAKFGRYAVKAASPQGAQVQLVDRMAGPAEIDGVVGERDGRVDTFLGPGDHKAVLTSLRHAKAAPSLTVSPFEELNGATPPRLVELAPVAGELGDLQQRSYWLRIDTPRTVFIEAAGRRLTDLRLWRDGTWLTDATPTASVSEPQPGKPLAVRRLVTRLEPGLYLMTAYGGVGETWTEAGKEQPFFLRWGIPTWPEAARRQQVVGPFGYDRWLLPKTTNTFRLELARPGNARLEVVPFNDGNFSTGKLGLIDKKSRTRAADVTSWADGLQVVTVTRQTGQPYLLQTYRAANEYTFNGVGQYLIETLRPGHEEDDPDDTAVLTRLAAKGDAHQTEQVIAARTIELGPTQAWRRRFNLLDTVTLFIGITEPGHYKVQGTGADADYTLAPFVMAPTMKKPSPQTGGGEWDLDAGIHVLTITPRPEGRGVLSLTMKGAAAEDAAEPAPAIVGATFAPVDLASGRVYRLYANRNHSGAAGALVRKLPADAADDVPLTIAPCATLSLPMSFPGAGSFQALTDDGATLPVSLPQAAAAGVQTVTVTNPGPAAVAVSLHFTPAAPPELPAVTPDDLNKLPNFPELVAGTPHFLDLALRQPATFVVKVDKPALYRLESSGLLETSGVIRTQVRPALDEAAANGVGRNFLLQQYLRPGLYQLTVATRGKTKGHLGVALTASPLVEGGPLTVDVAAHAILPGGQGLAYDLDIPRQGTYHLQTLTVGGPTGLRLEDAAGWPLTTPDQSGDVTRALAPGHYRLVVLPQGLTARVQTLVEEIKTAPDLKGHGPHPLPLETTVAYRWEEPAAGSPRTPDAWTFTLPAAADLTVTLSDRMQADLRRDGTPQPVAAITFRKPWQGRLAAGSYRLELSSQRPNNHFDYHLTTTLNQLVAGQDRQVTAPAIIPISLGGGRRVEITSAGGTELRGVLVDAQGNTVARAAERPDDWNFNITASPPAGEYQLKIEALGAPPPAPAAARRNSSEDGDQDDTAETPKDVVATQPHGSALIRLRQFDEVDEPPLALSADKDLTDGQGHSFPLAPQANDGALLVIAAKSRDTVGLALDRRAADGHWETIGHAVGRTPHLALARSPDGKAALRLHVWSMDHTRSAIAVHLRAVTPSAAGERTLSDGIALAALPGFDPPLGVAAVRLDKPGLFRLEALSPTLAWATATDAKALEHGPEVVVAGGNGLWFVDALGTVKARRVVPDATAPLALTLPAGQSAGLPVSLSTSGPVLWLAESRLGQPGIAVGAVDAPLDARGMAVEAGAAVTLLPEATAEPVVRLWRADGQTDELLLTLRQFAFAKPKAASLDWGVGDDKLEAGAATAYALPSGDKRLQLALPPLTAAALLQNGAVQRVVWSGERGKAQALDTSTSTLLLLNAGPTAGQISATLSPTLGAPVVLGRGAVFSQWLPTAGSRRLEIALAPADRGKALLLRLAGAVDGATLVQRDGSVRTGTSLPVSDDAVVQLDHRPGLVTAWLDNGDADAWPPVNAAAVPMTPGTVALAGRELLWRFETPAPLLLHLASSGPVMTGLRRPSGLPDLSVWGQGAALHAFLPAGQTLLGLRPVQDGELSGTARLATSEPVAIAEGLGPKVRLAPGDARLFSFDLSAAGPIGVGVRGTADTARVHLLDASGRTLAEGTVAMTSLDPGRYYLLVENRPDGGVSEVQPALVGAARPDTAPPEDIKRHYWELVSATEGN